MWDRLEKRRTLTDPRVASVLRETPVSAFVAPLLAAAVPLDAPIATAMRPPRAILPPPRLLATLLQMLDLEKGVTVFFLGSTGGYVEALLAKLVDPAPVTVWEEDADLAAVARAALAAVGFEGRVTFASAPPDGVRFDRVTTVDQIPRIEPRAKAAIADMGFALHRSLREEPQFVKLVRSGDEYLELGATDASTSRGTDASAHGPKGSNIGRDLILGRMLENAWTDRTESVHDRQAAEVVADTFAKPGELPPMAADERDRLDAAKVLFRVAYLYQSAGDFDAAKDVYAASLAVRPTAEAHTFLGWVHSFEDRHEEAIAECEKAIAVDPTLGNPYNDIGAYLIERNRLDESIPWFEKAKAATRYCCYFYPYSNLGRVYMMKGMHEKARREFEKALRINPQYEYAREMLRRVERGTDYVA